MKRFSISSNNYINDSIKIRVYINNDLVEEVLPSESNSYKRKNYNIKLSNHYLFDCQFYNILPNVEKKLFVKCVLCSKTIQGKDNSTGHFSKSYKGKSMFIFIN